MRNFEMNLPATETHNAVSTGTSFYVVATGSDFMRENLLDLT